MQLGTDGHATDDLLEQYEMGRLDTPELIDFEEHLLVCKHCQDNLAFMDSYLQSMRSAAGELRRHPVAAARPRHRGWFAPPKLVGALSLAAVALLMFVGGQWRLFRRAAASPALVYLQSTRGEENPLNSRVPAATPLVLALDLTDLPALSRYKLEIVDAAGHAVFGSDAQRENNRIRAAIGKGLPGGTYYVRLYAPGQELLREYGFEVRR